MLPWLPIYQKKNDCPAMLPWFLASALIHTLLFLVLWLGLPQFNKPLPEPPTIIPVEIAEISEVTAAKIVNKPAAEQKPQEKLPEKAAEKAAEKAPEKAPEKPVEKPPEPKPPEPKPPEPKPPEPAPKPEPPKPPAPPAEPLPEPKPEPPAPPKPPEVKEAEPLPQPKPKPAETKPAPPKVEKPQSSLASVLKDVAKLKKVEENKPSPAPKTPTPPKPDAPTPAAAPARVTASAATLAQKLSLSERDALIQQIRNCWNVPVGARDAQNIAVEISLEINADRTVQRAVIVDQARYNQDGFFRAMADSAIRALKNPQCTPLALPPEKYQEWHEMIFNFNPRDML